MQNPSTLERYVSPKEIAAELESKHGLSVSVGYVRAIRSECERCREPLFIRGMARTSEVFAWLKAHGDFKMRPAVARKAA